MSEPTIITEFPGKAVEEYRLEHCGKLPGEPYNQEHERVMLNAHLDLYRRHPDHFATIERRLFSEIFRLRHAAKRQRTFEPFVVRHYEGDKHPSIKGNGFDGLRVGDDRDEAEAFVKWINDQHDGDSHG